MAKSKIPVTLVTGYLGSGKTTFVNQLLSGNQVLKLAVLVNEFGEVGVDGALIQDVAGAGSVLELANGCLCCVVSGEFQSSLQTLLERKPDLDHVVIEASGAADPVSIVKAFWGAPELTARFKLDGVLCLVDAVNMISTMQADPIATLQAAVADVVILSKVDRANPAQVASICGQISAINPSAKIIEASYGRDIPVGEILGINAYRKFRPAEKTLTKNSETVSHSGLTSMSACFDGQVKSSALQTFFQTLVMRFGDQIVRTKGIIHVQGEQSPWLIQGVQNWIERTKAPKSYIGQNRLVVLGRNIDADALRLTLNQLSESAI